MRFAFPLLLIVATQTATRAAAPRPVTPDDYFSLAAVTSFAVSPDGLRVAYAEARWDAGGNDRKSDMWVVGTGDNPAPRRVTFDRANDRLPKWAADSRTVYFLGNRKRAGEAKPPYDGSTQVWRLSPASAEPQPVTREPGGVTGYDLTAASVYFTVDSSSTDADPFTGLRQKFGSLDYGHGKRAVSAVRRLDVTTWRTETVVPATRYVREFAATRDGKRLAMVTAKDDSVIRSEGESRVDVWDADAGVVTPDTAPYRAKAASPHAWLEGLAWNREGTRFAFCAIFDAYPAELVVGSVSSDVWTTAVMARPAGVHIRGYGSPVKWTAGGLALALVEKEGLVTTAAFDAEKKAMLGPKAIRPRVTYMFDADDIDAVSVAYFGTAGGFPELYRLSADGTDPKRLTTLNPQTGDWKLPTVSHMTWTAADGSTVGGILELPAGYQKGTKLPLVIGLHGGPTTAVHAAMEFDPYLGRVWLPAKGYALLCPNYRGSTGYGDKFLTDLIGRENDLDVSDIVAGAKKLVADGVADPDRVGVLGWSNGGYLTNCLITRTDLPFKLKAASSGAGIMDIVTEWGTNDEPAYPKVFKKGTPWEVPDSYRKTSPIFGMKGVTTPTLIHVGGNDERCPPGHSRMLYRALKEFVNVPTELVVYPGEPHGLTKLDNRRAKMEWDAAWFAKYLK